MFGKVEVLLSLTMVLGLIGQSLGAYLRIPSIIILLIMGISVGPYMLDYVRPEILGESLKTFIDFAVAIVLFEGGICLNIKKLQKQVDSIIGLITVGALITLFGAAFVAMIVFSWTWTQSILFGSLVIVTGPTVINPLLKRMRVRQNVATVLEAEGIFIDAVGALMAIIILEFAITQSGRTLAIGTWYLVFKLAFGIFMGSGCGLLTGMILKRQNWISQGLENLFILSMMLLFFHASNVILHESGLMTAISAGLVLGNIKVNAIEEIKEFKEQLTQLIIGMLFILLAANVNLDHVIDLGPKALLTTALLMLVVRPINVFVSTRRSDLTFKEKLFMSWIAPRGIVAAAVATLFSQMMRDHNMVGGSELQALVFAVIFLTVSIQGATGDIIARFLDLKKPRNSGFIFLDFTPLGRCFADLLRAEGEDVVFIESNHFRVKKAQEENFKVVYGNRLDDRVLMRSGLEGRSGVMALADNDEVNFLFLKNIKRLGAKFYWMPIHTNIHQIDNSMISDVDGRILFARDVDIDKWNHRLEGGSTTTITLKFDDDKKWNEFLSLLPKEINGDYLPLYVYRRGKVRIFDNRYTPKKKDAMTFIVDNQVLQKFTDLSASVTVSSSKNGVENEKTNQKATDLV